MTKKSRHGILCGDLTISGVSIAGEQTAVAVPELDVCFDIGLCPRVALSCGHICLTHGHMDHAAGFAYYLSQRNFCGMSPGMILVPHNLLKPIREIINAWGRLDGNEVPGKVVGIKPGDEYQYVIGKWDGSFDTFKTCGVCLKIRRDFAPCAPFGCLNEEMWECHGVDIITGRIRDDD